MNINAFRDFSYGVYILTSKDGERPVGCVANSSMQITSQPPTFAVSVNHDNFTNSCIKKTGVFALSVMSEDCDPSIIGTFGFKSSRDTDKFAGIPSVTKSGLHIIEAAKSYIVCKLRDTLETKTHTVFLGEVTDAGVFTDKPPMTYDYYHRVIKGKAPKNAPTYEAEAENAKSPKWKCQICGYEADLDVLPDGFTCPLCGVPKELFVKI